MVKIPTSQASERATAPTLTANPPDEVPEVSREIMCPLTGELIERDDVDGLLDMYERLRDTNDRCYAAQIQIRLALAGMTVGDAKTRRVVGRRRKAVVTMPDDSWDQSILKEAYNSYPELREQVLKIDTVGVKMREFKKLINTSGPPDFEQFKSMVEKANRGQTGTPTVKLEV